MKPREQGGVVDSRLNVYGVENLKCADMSICPSNVSAVRCIIGYMNTCLRSPTEYLFDCFGYWRKGSRYHCC